jgi:predicted component of viral defense system (DUF524 family)
MRPLHRVVVRFGNGSSIDLEVQKGEAGPEVVINSRLEMRAFSSLTQPASQEPPPLCWRDPDDKIFEPLQLREQTDYLIDVDVPMPLATAIERSKELPTWPLPERLRKFFHRDPVKRWKEVSGATLVTGRLNFRSHVGIATLRVDNGPLLHTEVVPRKLGYSDDFRALLTAIAEKFTALLIRIDAGTVTRLGLGGFEGVDPRAILFHLRRVMDASQLPQAVEHILESGSRRLLRSRVSTPLADLSDLDPSAIAFDVAEIEWDRAGPMSRLFRGYTPRFLPEVKQYESADTLENRYVKAFLEELRMVIYSVERNLQRDGFARAAIEVHAWAEQVGDWLLHPVWHEVTELTSVPTNSQLLQRARGYRDVLAADLSLQLGIELPWERGRQLAEGLEGDLRPIDELYQYWCFFVLQSVLTAVCGGPSTGGSLLRWSSGRFRVNLQQGKKSRVSYRCVRNEVHVADVDLFYNRTFRRRGNPYWYASGSYSAEFRPDYSILIRSTAAQRLNEGHWIHFDAKYRLDLAKWRSGLTLDGLPAEIEGTDPPRSVSYRRENLDEMHAYRDALLGSRGAYVLYPGVEGQEDIFIRRPGARYSPGDDALPGVGAFQLRPSSSGADSFRLEAFLRAAIDHILDATGYQEEAGLI